MAMSRRASPSRSDKGARVSGRLSQSVELSFLRPQLLLLLFDA
jgi:hypothetical protein